MYSAAAFYWSADWKLPDRTGTMQLCLVSADRFPCASLRVLKEIAGKLISLQFLIIYHEGAACSQWNCLFSFNAGRIDWGGGVSLQFRVSHVIQAQTAVSSSRNYILFWSEMGGWTGGMAAVRPVCLSVVLKMSKLWWKLSSVIRCLKNVQSVNTFSARRGGNIG